MRFEVKGGGIFAILIGLGLLSVALFVLGVLAGYDVGRESQGDTEKVATTYPIAAPPVEASPAAPPAPAISPAPVAQTAAAPPSVKAPAPNTIAPPRVATASAPIVKPRNHPPIAAPNNEAEVPAPAPPVSVGNSAAQAVASTANRPPPPPDFRRKPFNIEIEAAMDSASAGQMARRLQALGYHPRAVPREINGTTWYRVEVGPYATQAEAAAAETELRRSYNTVYGRGGAPAQAASDSEQGSDE